MTTTTMSGRRTGLAALLLAAATALGAPAASAQSVRPDARWQGWLGCWQPVTATSADSYTAWMEQRARDAGAPTLCIVPSTTPTAVDFVTVTDGKVTARETVDAGNAHRALRRDDCDGWEGAQWSPDARRVYLKSEYDCPAGIKRTSSGMLAMSGAGELLDIQEIGAGSAKSVRVARYHGAAVPAGLAIDSALVPRPDALPVTAARASMAGGLTGSDIVDAVNNVDSLVVEAWLVERGDHFIIDAKHLAALADAGVPGRITDLMIALSYPKYFALDRSQRLASMAAPASGSTIYATLPPNDPFGYRGGYGGYPPGYGPLGYSPYLYDGFGYPRYGYGGYGYGYGYVYEPAVVIVRGSGSTGRPHGRVVNGHGYTRGDPPPSGSTTSESRRPASGTSSGSSGSSSSSSSSSGSGETRHAKPRP